MNRDSDTTISGDKSSGIYPPLSPDIATEDTPQGSHIKEIAKDNFLPLSSPSIDRPLSSIKTELQTKIETRKLKKISGIMQKSHKKDEHINIDLKPHKISSSSNPVAFLREEYFVPIVLIEAELNVQDSSGDRANIKNLQKYYNKDDLINNAYFLIGQAEDKDEKSRLISIVKYLTTQPHQFIAESTLEKTGIPHHHLTRNIEPRIKLSDIKNNAISAAANQAIKKNLSGPASERMILSPLEATVYKGGMENMRELLAMQKADIEGYADILHLKEPAEIEDLTLTWDHTPLSHPIKSEFLKGYSHIHTKDWALWGEARKNYDLELFKEGKVSEETQKKLDEAEQEILKYGADRASVCKLAFYEIKINPNDFHFEQFMIGPDPEDPTKKRMVSIDEGRWGAPDVAYPFRSDGLAVTFKNALITHPDCLRPVPEDFRSFLKKRLGEIDQTFVKMAERNLICFRADSKKYEDIYSEIVTTLTELGRNRVPAAEMPKLAAKYGIQADANTTIRELEMQIISHLRAKKMELKEMSFPKQSEEGLVKELEREKRMAEYILQNPSSTIYGAFEVGYPELATFMKVMRRMERDPGSSIAYQATGQFLTPRNLKTFLATIIKSGMASEEEIAQMKNDLVKLDAEHKIKTVAINLTSDALESA